MDYTVTATEFKMNLGRYLDLLGENDTAIYITRNGKLAGKLTNPITDPVQMLTGVLKGSVSEDYDKGDLKEERLAKY